MARLLLYFALHPDDAVHVRELGRRTGLAAASIQNELRRLQRLGLIVHEQAGRRLLYRLDSGSPAWPAFRALIRQLAQPAEVLREAFSGIGGVDAAFVFGSHARGDTRPDSDVDLFLLGDEQARRALSDPLTEAEFLLGRDLDVIAYTPERIMQRSQSNGGFLQQVLEGPKQWVAGDLRILDELRPTALIETGG
jgi:predicted nucleotidyltransferase